MVGDPEVVHLAEKQPSRCSGVRSLWFDAAVDGPADPVLTAEITFVFHRALAIQQEQREKTGRKRSGYAAFCKNAGPAIRQKQAIVPRFNLELLRD